jgi:transposase
MPNESLCMPTKIARKLVYGHLNERSFNNWTVGRCHRLTAIRSRLVKVRKMLQSPLTDSDGFIAKKAHNEANKSCQKTLDALDKDIKQIKLDIENTIQNDPYLKELYQYVESVKGVGPAIATELLIITNEFKDITDPKKLAASAVRLSCWCCAFCVLLWPIQRQNENQQ